MITVNILINGQPIFTRSAENIKVKPDNENSIYQLDTGYFLEHKRKDGAIKLAIKMLKTIKEL